VSEVSEMARVCQRGLVGFGICDIHHITSRPLSVSKHSLSAQESPFLSISLPYLATVTPSGYQCHTLSELIPRQLSHCMPNLSQ
jgi:hypothetical protein